MLTYLLVRLADCLLHDHLHLRDDVLAPNTQSGIIGDICRCFGQVVRPVFELVPKIDPAPWRNGGRDSHHRSACITIRGTFAGDDFLNSDGRHSRRVSDVTS